MDLFAFNDPVETDIFKYYPPLAPVRGFVSIPHSGLTVPDEFRPYLISGLSDRDLHCDVDFAVDQIVDIEALQNAGICVLVAKIHRACIDLNRTPDTAVFSWKSNTQGVKMIEREPEEDIVKGWTELYHKSYFDFMTRVVEGIQDIKLGFVSLLDLHSMPSKPTAYHLAKNPNQSMDRRKDFCLSNLQGLSCQRSYISGYEEQLTMADYSVAINDPYFGGYVTQFMDQNYKGNVIQCEINRDIYMREAYGSAPQNKTGEELTLVEDKVKELKPVLSKIIIDVNIAFNTPFLRNQQVEAEGAEKDEIDAQFAFAF